MTIKISVELSSEDIEAICANYNVDSLDPINIDCVEARQQEFSQALRELMVSHVISTSSMSSIRSLLQLNAMWTYTNAKSCAHLSLGNTGDPRVYTLCCTSPPT